MEILRNHSGAVLQQGVLFYRHMTALAGRNVRCHAFLSRIFRDISMQIIHHFQFLIWSIRLFLFSSFAYCCTERSSVFGAWIVSFATWKLQRFTISTWNVRPLIEFPHRGTTWVGLVWQTQVWVGFLLLMATTFSILQIKELQECTTKYWCCSRIFGRGQCWITLCKFAWRWFLGESRSSRGESRHD